MPIEANHGIIHAILEMRSIEKMKEVGVGILGFGTVGAGVAKGLLEHRAVMAERLGDRRASCRERVFV